MGRTVTKSIAIIGEGETEWFYFDSLRVACRYPFKVAPDFPQHSDTEFWFLLHFLPNVVCRRYESYEQLLPELQKYMPGYEKTKRYFIRTNLYKYLTENGDLERAMINSEKLCQLCKESPEDLKAYSEVHKVIELLINL